jgi:predicted TIM-barrel fold metal-dependent hydrolase
MSNEYSSFSRRDFLKFSAKQRSSQSMNCTESEREAMLYGNARRLLRIGATA